LYEFGLKTLSHSYSYSSLKNHTIFYCTHFGGSGLFPANRSFQPNILLYLFYKRKILILSGFTSYLHKMYVYIFLFQLA